MGCLKHVRYTDQIACEIITELQPHNLLVSWYQGRMLIAKYIAVEIFYGGVKGDER